jgi:hypothetical protein
MISFEQKPSFYTALDKYLFFISVVLLALAFLIGYQSTEIGGAIFVVIAVSIFSFIALKLIPILLKLLVGLSGFINQKAYDYLLFFIWLGSIGQAIFLVIKSIVLLSAGEHQASYMALSMSVFALAGAVGVSNSWGYRESFEAVPKNVV